MCGYILVLSPSLHSDFAAAHAVLFLNVPPAGGSVSSLLAQPQIEFLQSPFLGE